MLLRAFTNLVQVLQMHAQQFNFLKRTEEMRKLNVLTCEKNAALQRANEKGMEELKLVRTRAEELDTELAGVRAEVATLSSENSALREGKEESDTQLATANSKVDELQKTVAEVEQKAEAELKSCQAELEAYKKKWEDEVKSKSELTQQLELRIEDIKKEAIAKFRQSDYFTDNLLVL